MRVGSKTKKASKMPKTEDEVGKGAHRRGRPRVESHDESALEVWDSSVCYVSC